MVNQWLKAKFHYAVWFEAGRRQVRIWSQLDLQRAETWPII